MTRIYLFNIIWLTFKVWLILLNYILNIVNYLRDNVWPTVRISKMSLILRTKYVIRFNDNIPMAVLTFQSFRRTFIMQSYLLVFIHFDTHINLWTTVSCLVLTFFNEIVSYSSSLRTKGKSNNRSPVNNFTFISLSLV